VAFGLVVATAALAACDRGDTSDKAPASCSWPARYDATDGGVVGQCVAARLYLSCRGSNGGGESCLSNDPTQCPGPNPVVGVTFSDCQNQCKVGEYALACGGPGPGPWPQPTPECRSSGPQGPGGGVTVCCPCGP
jgi:hypothetical protein